MSAVEKQARAQLGIAAVQRLDDLLAKLLAASQKSPIDTWLENIPPELDSKKITSLLKEHFPELFV